MRLGVRKYISGCSVFCKRLNDKRIVTFYLSTSEEVRYRRMLERGDKEEDAKRRIENDKKLFASENIPNVKDYIFNVDADAATGFHSDLID